MASKYRYRSDSEIIVGLLQKEADRLIKALYKAEKEFKEDPLKELLDLRMEASKILQDKKLTPEARNRKLKPLAARERIANLKIKNGWCILKKSDEIIDIKMELNSIRTLLGSWEWRFSIEKKRMAPEVEAAELLLGKPT